MRAWPLIDDSPPTRRFHIGEVEIDIDRNRILVGRLERRVEPKVLDLFALLASHSGEVISREALIDAIWKVECGGDESLSRAISLLRKTLKALGVEQEVIETIPKRGYRLVAPLPSHGNSSDSLLGAGARNRSMVGNAQIAAILAASLAVAISLFIALEVFTSNNTRSPAAAGLTTRGADSPTRDSVRLAVIPFDAMSSDPEDQHFADGLSEELLNWLANVEGLKVPARTTSFYFRDKSGDLRDIGERLGVDYVLEGSVRKSKSSLRIAAQLIEVRTGFHLWSKVYEKERSDIFAIQDEIARLVVTELLGKIPDSGAVNPAAVGDVDPKAHELYLEGRAYWAARNAKAALQKFREAVAIDPRHALAQAYVAVIAAHFVTNGFSPPGLDNPDAVITRSLAEAIKLRPNTADVLFAKAWVAETRSGIPPGHPIKDRSIIEAYEAVVRANPRHVEALHALTRAAPSPEKKIAIYQRVLEIDPSHAAARANLANEYKEIGDREGAALVLRHGLVASPDARFRWAAQAKMLGDLALAGEAAFGDEAGFARDGYLRWISASLLADLGATPEARYLSVKSAGAGDPIWQDYLRTVAATLDGDVRSELSAAQAFHNSGHDLGDSAWMLANALIGAGDYVRAYELIVDRRPDIAAASIKQEYREWDHFADMEFVTAAHALDLAGRHREAQILWNGALARAEADAKAVSKSRLGWADSLYLALLHSRLGDRAKSVKYFQAAYDAGFRFLAGYNCSDCIYDGFSSTDGLFAELVKIPENAALIERIKAENAKTLDDFNKKYRAVDRVREMMVAEAAANHD